MKPTREDLLEFVAEFDRWRNTADPFGKPLVRLVEARLRLDAKPTPVCSQCNDTHWVETEYGKRMCQYCPIPCQKCRVGGNGPFCETTPCSCECHKEPNH